MSKEFDCGNINFTDYQKECYRALPPHDNKKEEVMHWTIGLGEEAGEVLSVIKHKYYGGTYDVEEAVGEMGDVLWYVAALCASLGIDMQDVVRYNVAKLRYRHPGDDFNNENSVNRHGVEKTFKKDSETRKIIMDDIMNKMGEVV